MGINEKKGRERKSSERQKDKLAWMQAKKGPNLCLSTRKKNPRMKGRKSYCTFYKCVVRVEAIPDVNPAAQPAADVAHQSIPPSLVATLHSIPEDA